MAFPSIVKTWTTSFNQAVTAAADASRTQQKMALKFKDLLVAAGWTVRSSNNAGSISGVNYGGYDPTFGSHFGCTDGGQSDGLPPPITATRVPHANVAGGGAAFAHFSNAIAPVGTDLWVTAGFNLAQSTPLGGHILLASVSDVNPGIAGARHSWIVLRNAAIGTGAGVEILLDMNAAGAGFEIFFSPGAGFTGGTVTDRPTAADERSVHPTFCNLSASNPQHQFHLWYSTDGQCTRIMVCRGGFVEGFFAVERLQNPVTGFANPIFVTALYTAVNGVHANPFASLVDPDTVNMWAAMSPTQGTWFSGSYTYEGWSATLNLPSMAINTFNSAWPVMAMGVACAHTRNTGRVGNVFDQWHSPVTIADADTFANGGSGVVKLGGLVLPWDGSTTVLLT